MHILKLTIFSLQYTCIISFILKITGMKTTKFCIHKSKVVCEGLSHQTSQNGYQGVPQHSIAENVSKRFLIKSSLKPIKHQIQIKIINIINVETFFVLLKFQKIIQIIFFFKREITSLAPPTLWCSQIIQDSKALYRMEVAIPPSNRPNIRMQKLLKCCQIKIIMQ